MPAVGAPAPFRLVAACLVGSLLCWAAAAGALLAAAPDLAAGRTWTVDVLLAAHLLALGFLPLAVAGGALHVLPTLLRTSPDPRLGWAAFALLCSGPPLAAGIAADVGAVVWPCVGLLAGGVLVLAAQVARLVARAPRGRMLLVSRFAVASSALHALLALAAGPLLFALALPVRFDRLVAIHLNLAAIGWLTLLIVAVGRTLAPMLALAPSEPVRRAPLEELALVGGLWVALAGLAAGSRALVAAGGAIVLAALARFAAVVARAALRRRIDALEAPILHFLAGLLFVTEGAAAAVVLLVRGVSARTATAYVLLVLLGWGAGITIGHAGKLLALSAWTWWPPGPRPKQAELFSRRLWAAEAGAFALGVELAAGGAVLGSAATARAGAALLVAAAALALAGAARTLAVAGGSRRAVPPPATT